MRRAYLPFLASLAAAGCVTTQAELPADCGAPATALVAQQVLCLKTYTSGREAGTAYELLLALTSEGNRIDGSYALAGRHSGTGTARLDNTSYGSDEIRFSVNPASNPRCRHDFIGTVAADKEIEGTFTGCSGGGTWQAQF